MAARPAKEFSACLSYKISLDLRYLARTKLKYNKLQFVQLPCNATLAANHKGGQHQTHTVPVIIEGKEVSEQEEIRVFVFLYVLHDSHSQRII